MRQFQKDPSVKGVFVRYFSSLKYCNEDTIPSKPSITKLLVANRGEIACRVLMTARKLGIPTVAVYSDADKGARHVKLSDESFHIGDPAATRSYLRGSTILDVAARSGADALHPGYGFLSENAEFAASCSAAGLKWVGPPASAIRAMGNKSEAKRMMSDAGVPVVPGYHGDDQAFEHLVAEAERIGFPLLVKAVSGGGGKGMKLAHSKDQLKAAIEGAQREAKAAFGDDRLLLERYVPRSRHVEVQVVVDSHGNAVHLHDRDCSVQRRHQKIIEEAPAPGLAPEVHAELGAAAVRAALAAGYVNAGTVEFLMDIVSGEHYFMEMNTRLQVEHPVTEAVSGVDLVEWQLRVAAGEKLPCTQEQLGMPKGHAFEARLYAESPRHNFLPGGGRVRRWQPPKSSEFSTVLDPVRPVRVDSGMQEGDEVGINYDPLIAKIITWGPDRRTALSTLSGALGETRVAGLTTNLDFLSRLSENHDFAAAEALDTHFIEAHKAELFAPQPLPPSSAAVAGIARYLMAARISAANRPDLGPWGWGDSWRPSYNASVKYSMEHPEGSGPVEIQVEVVPGQVSDMEFQVKTVSDAKDEAAAQTVHVRRTELEELNSSTGLCKLVAEVDGQRLQCEVLSYTSGLWQVLDLWWVGAAAGRHLQLRWPATTRIDRKAEKRVDDGAPAASHQKGGSAKPGDVISPMFGKVVKVLVKEGEAVAANAPVVVLEAMKMEHTVTCSKAGTVGQVFVTVGGQVSDGQVLVRVD